MSNINYSKIKEIKTFCESLTSEPAWREVVENFVNENTDFTVDNVRFISSDCIDEIQQDELAGEEYILGCFNAWFIADCIGIDQDVIDAMQKVHSYEAVCKLIISLGKLPTLQSAYASADGYGHHFNHYDFNEEEITVNGVSFYVFDNRS